MTLKEERAQAPTEKGRASIPAGWGPVACMPLLAGLGALCKQNILKGSYCCTQASLKLLGSDHPPAPEFLAAETVEVCAYSQLFSPPADRVLLYSPGCPQIHHPHLSTSASHMVELQLCRYGQPPDFTVYSRFTLCAKTRQSLI